MKFSRDFFSKNIPTWEKHLAKFKDRPTNALELGSFEGRSAVWLLENILTHAHSRLICVDLGPCDALAENLAQFDGKVVIRDRDATQYARGCTCQFDIIYVDAHHIARDVILQAGLLWPLLNTGGVMIFDDYGHKEWTVKPAVDFFLDHWPDVTVLHRGWQAIVEKRNA